jgi:acyl-coenzyme A synthetase/AMP-(fatty) acid ligase/acyl carrier protein
MTAAPATPTPDSLIERLFYHADNNPIHDAVVTPMVALSYAQLAQLVRAQVKEFNNANISDKSVIGIKCADDIQHLVLCLAATHIGATSCTIPSYEAEQTQNSIVSRCGTTHIIDEAIAFDPVTVDPASQDRRPLESSTESIVVETPNPEAQLLFSTSGTTGEPKLVIHHDSDLVAQAHRHVSSEQERFACLASMEHNFAKRHRLYCVAVGATNVFFSPEQELLVAQSQSLNVNVMHVSAFQAQELLAMPDIGKLSNIRLKLGGSHTSLSLRQQLRGSITNNLQAGYGTTETGAIAFTDPNDLGAGESVGQPLPGVEIRVVTPKRKTLGNGKRGELAVRCKGMFRGYLGKPNMTDIRLEGEWFYTGDIGYLDSQQRIHLCGRSDDMFMFNSMNIYPQDIESEIRQFPGIIDAAVLPKTSPVHGNIPVALIVFAKHVKQHLPALKKFVQKRVGVRSPRQYIIVAEIPTNASGKISRRNAMSLPEKSSQIRSDIINMLNTRITKHLNPSLIAAFKNGDEDITFSDLGMDSLDRMEFLVALEIDYDTIITPREFGGFRYLGNIVSHILSPPSQPQPEQNSTLLTSSSSDSSHIAIQATPLPYVVRFFQRIFSYCHTAAQLNKALTTLEHRLTPMDVEYLHDWHLNGQLIPTEAATKFQKAVSYWLKETKSLMLKSGKNQPEPFVSRKITPTIIHFSGPGSPTEKTLLICFPPSGIRHLTIPNAVLMQHTDSARFDLLIVSDPFKGSYQLGTPPFGKFLSEAIERLANQDLISGYNSIRTLGFSAGAYPALIAGYILKAEMAVSVSGRFHRKRYILKNLDKIITTWKAVRKGHCARVLMSYSTDHSRDQKYAKIIGKISGGNKIAIKIENEKTRHLILQRLLERGELAVFLTRTIFAEMNDKLIATKRANTIMSFPAAQIRPYE